MHQFPTAKILDFDPNSPFLEDRLRIEGDFDLTLLPLDLFFFFLCIL